jgi:hypothetical protein
MSLPKLNKKMAQLPNRKQSQNAKLQNTIEFIHPLQNAILKGELCSIAILIMLNYVEKDKVAVN